MCSVLLVVTNPISQCLLGGFVSRPNFIVAVLNVLLCSVFVAFSFLAN